jgi:hypothetical protein
LTADSWKRKATAAVTAHNTHQPATSNQQPATSNQQPATS